MATSVQSFVLCTFSTPAEKLAYQDVIDMPARREGSS
jgi:hypothetical protein